MLSLFGVEALLGTEHAGRAQHWYFHVQLLAPWLSLPRETNHSVPPTRLAQPESILTEGHFNSNAVGILSRLTLPVSGQRAVQQT